MTPPVLPGEGPDPMTDEALARARAYIEHHESYGGLSVGNLSMLRRLLDEVQRLKTKLSETVLAVTAPAVQLAEIGAMVGYPDPPLIVEMVRAELERSRSECAALTAKAGKLAEFADSVRRAQPRSEHTDVDAGWNACLESIQDGLTIDVLAAIDLGTPRPPAQALASGPETVKTSSGMGTGEREPHGRSEVVVWGQGADCPHKPEWHCENHGECRGCECGCDTVNPEAETDLSLIPAHMVVSDPGICSGQPTMRGTRILAEVIAGELAAGTTWETLREWYPSLPVEEGP